MLRSFIFGAWLFCSATAAAQSAPPASGPRAPTGPWVVDFHESQCIAYRPYGTTEQPLHLVLKSPALGDLMQLSVLRDGSRSSAQQVKATIRLDERGPITTNMLIFGTESEKFRIHQINLRSADFALVREAKSLSLRAAGLDESFALSGMAPLLRIMDECAVDLRRVWNVKESSGETSELAVRAKGNVGKVVHDRDYPAVALAKDQSGIVSFVLLVNEKGRVADCTVTETSGVASLDAQTCAILKERARFEPAIAADGKPAKDAFTARIHWKVQPLGR